jgi:hypothetical protein
MEFTLLFVVIKKRKMRRYTEINEELDDLYAKKWQTLSEKLKEYNSNTHLGASNPLLLKLGEHFNFDFDDRGDKKIIMCFGQETNGNGAFSGEIKGYEKLINQENSNRECTKNWKNGKNYHRWCGVIAHKWLKDNSKELFGVEKEDVFVIWNNIRKISTKTNSKTRGKIDEGLKKIIKENFNIIPRELEIINPDFLFFFTGNNDEDIKRFVGKMENKEDYEFKTAKGKGSLCRFNIKNYNALRGYYPILNSTFWKNQKEIIIKEKLLN